MGNVFQRPFSHFVNQDSGSDLGVKSLFGGYEQEQRVSHSNVS